MCIKKELCSFGPDQCVAITTRNQYKSIYHYTGSSRTFSNLEEWEEKYFKIGPPMFPFYIVWMNSVTRGRFIARESSPDGREILTFKEATL